MAYSHLWTGCIEDKLNTVVKLAIKSKDICFFPIGKDLTAIKSIVDTLKRVNYNADLPKLFKMQEVLKTFGTTFDVFERFIKSGVR